MAINRRLAVMVTATMLGSALNGVVGLDLAVAAPATCQPADPERMSPGDVNGDAVSDVVVGVPSATIDAHAGAGAVDIHYRAASGAGTTQRLDEASFGPLITPTAGDRFGAAVALAGLSVHNVDATGCADPVIGVSGAGSGRGAVIIAQGTSSGVSGTGAIRINGRTAGEHFGAAVVADGRDLFIAAPDRTVSGRPVAGAVDHYRISGSTATLVQTLTESTAGVPGDAEPNDRFGEVLALQSPTRLVVGQPEENIGHAADAGAVTIVTMSATTGRLTKAEKISQDSFGITGVAEPRDHFGASVSIMSAATDNDDRADSLLAVGVPGESLGSATSAGMVNVLDVGTSHAPKQVGAVDQATRGFPGGPESGDQLGAAVQLDNGNALRIGVPGEDIGTVRDAGEVMTAVVSTDFVHFRYPVAQQGGTDTGDLGATPQADARVGAALGRLAKDGQGPASFGGGEWVLIGLPGAAVGAAARAGAVVAKTARPYPSFTDSAGATANEGYGSVLAAVPSGGAALS